MFGMGGFGGVGDLMFLHDSQKEEVLRRFADSDPDDCFEDRFSAALNSVQDCFTDDEIEEMREDCLTFVEDRNFC